MRLDAIVQARLEVGSLRQTSNFRLEPKGPGLYQHGTTDPKGLLLNILEQTHQFNPSPHFFNLFSEPLSAIVLKPFFRHL